MFTVKSKTDLLRQFCLIELQILTDREERLRKEILHCKIQREYLTQVAEELKEDVEDATTFARHLIKIETYSGEQ